MKDWWSFLFPKSACCWFCSTALSRHWLQSVWQQVCEPCQQNFQRIIIPGCHMCGRPKENTSLNPCADCLSVEQSFMNRSVVAYSDWVKQCIWRFKYKGMERLSEPIGRMMAELILECFGNYPFVVSYVPLAYEKKIKRGFNQSELLAKVIGRELSATVMPLIVRYRSTKAQSRKSRDERILSLQGAFSLNEQIDVMSLKNCPILIVDDIYTTGTTLRECIKPLVCAGFANVCSATFAR